MFHHNHKKTLIPFLNLKKFVYENNHLFAHSYIYQIFLSNTHCYMVSINFSYIIIIILSSTNNVTHCYIVSNNYSYSIIIVFLSNTNNVYKVIWFQAFLSKANYFQTDQFDP